MLFDGRCVDNLIPLFMVCGGTHVLGSWYPLGIGKNCVRGLPEGRMCRQQKNIEQKFLTSVQLTERAVSHAV